MMAKNDLFLFLFCQCVEDEIFGNVCSFCSQYFFFKNDAHFFRIRYFANPDMDQNGNSFVNQV